MITRRVFLGACGMLGPGLSPRGVLARPAGARDLRSFHLAVSPEALERTPGLLEAIRRAGVTDVWICGFFYGHWPFPIEAIRSWGRRAERQGMAWHVINVPLGHPGDALGSRDGQFPLTPPGRWRLGRAADGSSHAGTSIHPPAVEENADAMQQLARIGVRRVFLDDDFRLARGPGILGGCTCDDHRRAFQRAAGLDDGRWKGLIDAIARRDLTADVRAWVEFQCDEATSAFRAMRRASPEIDLGVMVMYLGAEKAGIRLADYRDVPFRVGEGHFDDGSFGTVKGKMDELSSVLFHRRFAAPDRAFSETTAFPATRLSAANMAAKLAISTIADVRNTMFMSGLSAFPIGSWATLGPAMKHQAGIHRKLAGHAPRGPLKHVWGEPSRYVGDDDPFSLFLALGIPFEVLDGPPRDGVAFLSRADAARPPAASPATLIARPAPGLSPRIRPKPESFDALLGLKRELIPGLGRNPYVEQDVPVVCAWYPTARAVLLWNPTEKRRDLTVKLGDLRRNTSLEPLGSALIEDLPG
ncbi:hypothetical protein OJF2_10990 [Aquisphaera giovannonii]|uniref:Uncharacterized protein n=1 Tax=Aquisphaera giovannonii TaxID=406548 RepID=A0A5B9VYC6_9BACT|nr:hypothetical protein [Aquisphaera giovannonii]QEH32620.1 hypothetical protein OJF2_10990 [Aquisphaera giovannonii]